MIHQSISTSRGRPVGAMTAEMRALSAGPRCLRVALVLGGRIVEERRIRAGASLTLGTSERADLVVQARGIPGRLVLFEPAGAGFRLLPPSGAEGRVALERGIESIARAPIDLDPSARGKIELGPITILFQIVPEPPAPVRPQLPHAVIEPALSVDWTTSVIAAFSFLAHFLFAGALYSEWLDPVLDQGVVVSGVVDTIASWREPPPVEQPLIEPTQGKPSPGADTKKPGQAGKQGRSGAGSAASGTAGLMQQLETLELGTLGVLNSGRPATEGVLKNGELPTATLDEAARSAKGVSSFGEISLSRGGPIARGSNDLSNLARRDVVGVHDTGSVKRVDGPKPVADASPPTVHGTVGDAARVVAQMRPGFRACYQRAINDYPDAQGKVFLRVSVGANGEVTNVGASASGNLPGSMLSCVKSRAAASQFEPPEGGAAVVEIPAWFVLR